MKFKKTKLLLSLLAFAPLCVLAGCNETGGNTTASTPTTTVPDTSTTDTDQFANVLSFIDKGKIRIELYDMDVNVSYGNSALSQAVNILTLSDNANITFSKNTTEDDVYCIAFIGEKVGSTEAFHQKYYKQIEGSSLQEFQTLVQNELKGYDRAFVTIAKGKDIKWTKGLSTKLDALLEKANSATSI